MLMIKTVVLGASPTSSRFSYKAVRSLVRHNYEVIPVGQHEGEIDGLKIETNLPELENIHTVTLYIGPKNQEHYLDYIKQLQPKRMILNPGTENDKIIDFAKENDIETLEDCTLVMLNNGKYI